MHLLHLNTRLKLLLLSFCFFRYSLQSCSVILAFAHEVPVCDVANAVVYLLQSKEQISFSGHVIRAGVYTNQNKTRWGLKYQLKQPKNKWRLVQSLCKASHWCFCVSTAICGNLQANVSLQSEFTWVSTDIKPADFCAAAKSSSLTWFVWP